MVQEFAKFAVTQVNTRGRAFREAPHRYRSDFERDRDRIIHSAAFRRLEGKTQVFTPGLDDHYRTRLTHTIEVAQIGRTLAKALGLSESLTEAICLAHDLGHSPFGHGGEQVLNELTAEWGGFEHNGQTLRIVDLLEHPYPDFWGLNLMYETRLGIARHHSPYDKPASAGDFSEANCTLEGQIAAIADRIAYNCHDLEDGMRGNLIQAEQLKNLDVFAEAWERVGASRMDDRIIRRTRVAKSIINTLVGDCLQTSAAALSATSARTMEDIVGQQENLIMLSPTGDTQLRQLEQFLMQNLYMHSSLADSQRKARKWLEQLFNVLCAEPAHMPRYFQRFIPQHGLQRAVCDYIAGMTDRFCLQTLREICPRYDQ